jgi:GGDEF domain-containing protein
MNFRFSLADKISMTIIIVGVFGVILVYYISSSYKQFAYQHHAQAIQQLATLEVSDLIDDLKANSLDLALAIEHEKEFQRDFRYRRQDELAHLLDNQFYQYFVTAGVLKLLKLYVLDTDFNLISTSTEGIDTGRYSGLICPELSQLAVARRGAETLQMLARICLYDKKPVFAVIVPTGGLNPSGYIQIITDLAYSLRKIEKSLAMPIQMHSLDRQPIYESEDWQLKQNNKNYLNVALPILSDEDKTIMTITLKSDMTTFNKEIMEYRNWIMALAFVTTAFTVFIVLLILQKSTIPPLAKIHDVLEKIHLQPINDSNESRLLFEQLLEHIIQLRRKSKTRFSVMILDLNHFDKINSDFGQDIGDRLLLEVEHRLGRILRDSDMISWIGTDSPGHKLLPADRKTHYRATIARLGGDEFGLLLPSAQTADQATTVAHRIVDTLNRPFQIRSHDIHIECKIGICIYPIHGEDEKMLIRNADKAMYKARSLNQTIFIYEPELEIHR